MQRIGVFVCWCGSNIAATVDVERVSQALAKEPGVVFSTNYQYMCSQTGQQMIQEKIHEYGLTGVVICSCSPRMQEQTFRKTCEKAGLKPYMVEIANIREQCSWIHKDKEAGTEKAIILGRAAIAKVHLNAPLIAGSSPVTKRALVIGGGIAGIQTALDIAEAGFEVDIVEKQPTIGGKMTQIDKTFPTLDCAACILTPKMVDCAQNEKIHIYSYSEIESVGGFVGNFHVKIRRKARFIKEDVCNGFAPRSARRRRSRTNSTSAWTTAAPSISPSHRPCRRSRPSTRTTATCSKTASAVCAQRSVPPARSTTSRPTPSSSRNTAPSSPRRASTPSTFPNSMNSPEPGRRVEPGI